MPRVIPLENNIPQLYPVQSELRLHRLQPTKDGNITVMFTTDYPEMVSVPRVTIPIQDCIGEGKRIEVRAKAKCGTELKDWGRGRFITIQVTPSQQYKASGLTSPGWITVKDTDIPFDYGTKVTDWLPEINKEHEREVTHLFNHVSPIDDYEVARAVLETLTDNLHDHKGTPTDKMQASNPYEQYLMAIKGESRAQCNNIVEIFVYFCRALGIPARRINLWQGGLWDKKTVRETGYNLQTAGGHTVAEIYDEDEERWVFLDPMYGIEGVFSEGTPLNLVQLQMVINDERLSKRVTISRYEPGVASLNEYFFEMPFFKSFKNYLNPTQRIGFVVP